VLLIWIVLWGVLLANAQQQKKPNILVIFGDDIGWFNVSAYNMGMMGYRTPNIDRIAREGMLFTDYYGQQSCTAGRAAFITGQSPLRTGLLKVGLPGAKEGLQKEDPTIADLLKPLAIRADSLARITWVTVTSICLRFTDLKSFSEIFITSTQRKSPNTRTIQRTLPSGRSSAREACFTRMPILTARRGSTIRAH
jgi:hypothetical protein